MRWPTCARTASTATLEPRTVEVVDTFRAIGAVQRRYGVLAARRYIVSFTQSAEHLAAVYELAELTFAGMDAPVIDAVPLFETFADLEASVDILDGALQLPQVQRRLAENGRRVEVMLGYSDSSKDVGPVSATLTLDTAQRRITEWARRNEIVLTLFHGRGGALGRGGGPANRALLAQPPGSVDGRFKLTEQGEVIFARYGDPVIAARHIEQVAAATLLAGAPSVERHNAAATERFAPLAAQLDETSRVRFHELVKAPGLPAVVRRGHAARGGRHAADRLAPGTARPVGGVARRPARDPVGVLLVAGPHQPGRLVRPGHRAGDGRRPRRAAHGLRAVAAVRHHDRQRRDVAGQDRRAHRGAVPRPRRPGRPGPAGAGRDGA